MTVELSEAVNHEDPVLVKALADTPSVPLVALTWRVWAGGAFPLTSALKLTGVVDIDSRAPVLTLSVTLTVEMGAPGALTVTVPE